MKPDLIPPHWEFLARGVSSEVYRVRDDTQSFVVHLAREDPGFQVVQALYPYLSAAGVILPEIYQTGVYAGYFFTVSRFIPGRSPADTDDFSHALNSLTQGLSCLHRAPLLLRPPAALKHLYSDLQSGYSWHRELKYRFAKATARLEEASQYQGLQDILAMARVTELFENLARICPAERYWLHGDLKPDNLRIDKDHQVALLDWNATRLGDWVFDYASLYLKSALPPRYFTETLPAHYQALGFSQRHYPQRLWFYTLYQGLMTLIHYDLLQEPSISVFIRRFQRRLQALESALAKPAASAGR
ncbi:MAG: aminoglycoside phosphotransferase family protein [Candidatus Sericytochromatia bacterium]|nr:aminoglycoside phosphotransferase family protein [Candidatus Sericytochromatia bacterium]